MNKGFDKGDVIRYELISWLLHWYWHCDFSVPDDLLCLTPDCLQPTGPDPVHVWWTHAWNRPGCSSMMSHLVDWLMNKNHLICWFIKIESWFYGFIIICGTQNFVYFVTYIYSVNQLFFKNKKGGKTLYWLHFCQWISVLWVLLNWW